MLCNLQPRRAIQLMFRPPNRLGFVFGVPALPAHTNDKYKDFYGGYHDGAVAAHNDYSSGKGMGFHGSLSDSQSKAVFHPE